MGRAEILEQRRNIIQQFGEWTTGFYLADGVYTREETANVQAGGIRLRRIVQAAADLTRKPLSELRVLDLACLEGMFAIEFARHGAEVIGLEGRAANVEKARFAKELLGLEKLEFRTGDVRELSRDAFGSFDLILCLGILYHLNAPDVFQFVERMADVCGHCLIIDTHISRTAVETRTYEGETYWGSVFTEHAPESETEERLKNAWASLDNLESFWLTRSSLLNLLARCGFTSVSECHHPSDTERPGHVDDRITLIAIKGEPVRLISTPAINELPEAFRPEGVGVKGTSPTLRIGGRIPGPIKRYIKELTR